MRPTDEQDGAPASDTDGPEFGNDTPSIETFDVSELVHDLINSSSILIQQNEAKEGNADMRKR